MRLRSLQVVSLQGRQFAHKLIDLLRHQTRNAGLVLTRAHKSISQGSFKTVEPGNIKLAKGIRVPGTLYVKLYLAWYIFCECHSLDSEDFITVFLE